MGTFEFSGYFKRSSIETHKCGRTGSPYTLHLSLERLLLLQDSSQFRRCSLSFLCIQRLQNLKGIVSGVKGSNFMPAHLSYGEKNHPSCSLVSFIITLYCGIIVYILFVPSWLNSATHLVNLIEGRSCAIFKIAGFPGFSLAVFIIASRHLKNRL